ncbi:MAG: CvpA family protein [Eubacterium sp.]
MGNILVIGVGLFMIAMIVVGLKRGMVKMAFSLVSVFVILILVNILTPSVKQALKSTPLYDEINKSIETYVNQHVASATEEMTQTGVNAQKKIIEGLPLPKGVKSSLVKNNNQQSYDSMEVDSFSGYVAEALSDMILGALTFVILFIVITILVKVLMNVLNLVAKLPVINVFNTAGGAIIGLMEAIIIIWIACIVVTICSATEWGQIVCRAISENDFLSFIYDNNIIQKIITGIFTV